MRKIKKINGYLVVKFNDREKRIYEGVIGEYGVIDAELYTGHLDMDRGAMEYDNAETLEKAIELARGLESEEDIEDTGVTYTLVTEGDGEFNEEEINPQVMIEGFTGMLESRVGSEQHKDMDARSAAHELHGFKTALNRLGLIDEEDTAVEPDTFGPLKEALPRSPEDLLAYVCDCVCKHRTDNQDAQDALCESCAVNRLYEEADAQCVFIQGAAQGLFQILALVPQLLGTIHTYQSDLIFQFIEELLDGAIFNHIQSPRFPGLLPISYSSRPWGEMEASIQQHRLKGRNRKEFTT